MEKPNSVPSELISEPHKPFRDLVARLVVMRDGADADARLAEEDSIQQWEAIGKSFAFNESAKQLAALEAAAPAGTAPLKSEVACVREFIQWAVDHIETDEAAACAEQATDAFDNILAALATPSPQTPATTPVDEPKNDDRAYGCYTCGKQGLKKGQRVSLVYCNECDAKHIEKVRRAAATQEQPAGSGANYVCAFNEKTYCLDHIACNGSGVCQYPMFKGKREVAPGSPRKVGEDGSDLIPRCMERHPEGGQCELRRGHARQHLAGMVLWGSVPVGEQPKEKP